MPELVVATYNVHGGVDGWGRPFDVVAACRELAADVLVLEELWAEAGTDLASDVAGTLGYEAHVLPMAPGVLHPPVAPTAGQWGPPRWRRRGVGLRLDPRHGPAPGSARAVRGTMGVALLSRLPVRQVERVDLGRFPGDLTRRGAVVAEVDVGGRRVSVAGTHMPHIRHGSVVHFRRLRRVLQAAGTRAVIVGDMNLWGPPLELLFPGWRRAVRGRTWPAWRPLAQLDHVLVPHELAVGDAAVLRVGDSDHRAVRATVVVA